MLTYEDCVAFSELHDDEVEAIAAQARVPPIVAVEIGRCMLDGRQDEQLLSRLIRSVADDAHASGDLMRASYLYMTMQRVHARHAAV